MSRRVWTEDKIKSEIQKLYEQDEDLWYRAMERNHKDLIRASERYYKGWKNAVEAAGIDYNKIKKRSHQVWTKEKILKQLNELRSGPKKLRSSEVQRHDKKLYHAAIRTFKSFNDALEEVEKQFGQIQQKQHKDVEVKGSNKPEHPFKPQDTLIKQTAINKHIGDMKIFTVRTRIRSERNVGEIIDKRAKSLNINIGTIQYPAILNGYIFVECDDRAALERLIKNIRNAQGLLNGETTSDEISKYIKSSKSRKVIVEGAKVEITDGQFKGERAVIQHINDRTKEVTVELMDEVLKMPITISKNNVKLTK